MKKEFKENVLELEERLLKDYEYEYGRGYFGSNLYEEPRSNYEVYHSLNEDELNLFMSISKIHKLTLEAQWCLMTEALEFVDKGEGIPNAIRNKLIQDSLRSVSVLAFKYMRKYNTKVTYADFISEGYIALCNAFDSWLQKTDEEKLRNIANGEAVFACFSTYAFDFIHDAFQKLIQSDDAVFSMSLSSQKKIKKLISSKAEFIKKYGYIPSAEELEKFSGFTKKTIDNSALFLTRVSESGEVSAEHVFKDFLEEKEAEVTDADKERQRGTILGEYLKNILNNAEFEVITSWYFDNKTILEIANSLGVTKSKVASIKEKALKNLKANRIILKKMLEEE